MTTASSGTQGRGAWCSTPRPCTANCCAACAACASRTRAWRASPPAAPGWRSACSRTWAWRVRRACSLRPCTATILPSAAWRRVRHTALPFDVNGADILVLDDVLYTGRTIRAVLNELFDYGRPASVRLAVLVDRGGRELPVQADFAAARVTLPASQSLALARNDGGSFVFQVKEA
jgi:hypothetical protein